MTKYNKQSGFGFIGVMLILAIVAVIGLGGWLVARHSKKATSANDSTQTSTTKSTSTAPQPKATHPTADELNAVAKQVYFQTADAGNPPTVSTCAVQDFNACPFTTALTAKINGAQKPSYNPSPAGILTAGSQNGPFGTVSYSTVPATQGGTVTVTATPDASLGDPTIIWKLTMSQTGSKLLVDDIMYTEGAFGSTKACGPIEIYNYLSCRQ